MPRIALDLNNEEDRRKVNGQWRVGPGLVPGQPNEGLTAQLLETAARLADYDDSGWDICTDIRKSISKGFTFAWYASPLSCGPVERSSVGEYRVWLETNVDNYAEIWIDGKLISAGAIIGLNASQRVEVNANSAGPNM
jgi:hypothetical protein